MHDIDLLKQLTEAQLKFVIETDPLIYAENGIIAYDRIASLKKQGISDVLIEALMLSWIDQLKRAKKHEIAYAYHVAYDEWKGTSLALTYAICHAQGMLFNREDVAWYDWLQAGLNAHNHGDKMRALQCFDKMNVLIQSMLQILAIMPKNVRDEKTAREHNSLTKAFQKNLVLRKQILQEAICEAEFGIIDACLVANVPVQRALTASQLKNLRYYVTTLFVEGQIPWMAYDRVWLFLTEHGSESEKRACVNAVSRLGNTHLMNELSNLWKIPLTVHHWKKALAKVWFDQPNDGKRNVRLRIARKLVAKSKRYQPIFLRFLQQCRTQSLAEGEIISANNMANELGEPLTIEEVTRVIRQYGNDRRIDFRDEQIPFAQTLLIQLIGPKPEPEQKTSGGITSREFHI